MDEERLEDLVRRARNGDADAAGELTRHYEALVRRSIQRNLGNQLRGRVDTDDVFQSTIRTALGDLRHMDYRGERAFIAWLTQVAGRRLLDVARRHHADKRDVRRERPLQAAAGRSAGLTSPGQGVVKREIAENLRSALMRLPPDERQIVELHTYQGLGFEEAASVMGLSGKTAARRLFLRALASLGDEIDGTP